MTVDSYFFASFQNSERAIHSIQNVLDERPSSDLPRPPSPTPSGLTMVHRQEDHGAGGPLGLKKIGSILKPLMSKSSDKVDDAASATDDNKSGFSIPFLARHKPSHDSLETLHQNHGQGIPEDGPMGEEWDGYPPRQAGAPPAGMEEQHKPGWSGWIKKPSKIFGSSPSHDSSLSRTTSGSSSLLGKTPPGAPQLASTSPTTRNGRRKRESVTEVVEPVVNDESDSEDERDRQARRDSFASGSDLDVGNHRSQYSLMERSESNAREDDETAKKFRSVFSLSDKEELLDRESPFIR